MFTMYDFEKKLRKMDYRQARLYLFCNFISLMLITAYSIIMLSPTVLTVLPEGGDSRKQMIAIFVLTLTGCMVFTVYATGLFFRQKSKQLGLLMALGASQKQLTPMLYREMLVLSAGSSLCGIAAGFPFVWLIWSSFRLIIVDSEEMAFRVDLKCLGISGILMLLAVFMACMVAQRYLKRTNILDVMQEEHKNEPVKEPGRWCGPVGVVLLFGGAVIGYKAPMVYMEIQQAYPPVWLNIFYLPVFVGLYMIMLHTVVHGWHLKRGTSYRNLISRSMMKFQGKQTVNNLLVSTVLIAGACFAIFYLPMLGTGNFLNIKVRPYDYLYHYRADQKVPDKEAVENMALHYSLHTVDWKEISYLTLGVDGLREVEEEDGHFHREYEKLLCENRFLSETDFNRLSGQQITVKQGEFFAVSNETETGTYYVPTKNSLLTNMDTRKTMEVKFAGFVHYGMLVNQKGYCILNDEDWMEMARGATPEWFGRINAFNIEGEDNYKFAKELFHSLVSSFDQSCELPVYYDRIGKISANERGEIYWGDTEQMTKISYDKPDSTDFRTYWTYMPLFRELDKNDFLRSYAVFLMTFLFLFIICITAACIICYTRCRTIALNNRYVFEDLKKLGAPPAFLKREIKLQCRTVIRTPSIIGIVSMTFLYSMIMYGNDGMLTKDETAGLFACGTIVVGIAVLLYIIYRKTVGVLERELI